MIITGDKRYSKKWVSNAILWMGASVVVPISLAVVITLIIETIKKYY